MAIMRRGKVVHSRERMELLLVKQVHTSSNFLLFRTDRITVPRLAVAHCSIIAQGGETFDMRFE